MRSSSSLTIHHENATVTNSKIDWKFRPPLFSASPLDRLSHDERSTIRLSSKSLLLPFIRDRPLFRLNEDGSRDPAWINAERITENLLSKQARDMDASEEIFVLGKEKNSDSIHFAWNVDAASVANREPDREGEEKKAENAFLKEMKMIYEGDIQFDDLKEASLSLRRSEDSGTLAYARSLLRFHSLLRFCSSCGHPTKVGLGGAHRQCIRTECKRIVYPRVDPAVLMCVKHPTEDHILLVRHRGRQAVPSLMYSCCAGFVESGESVEDAVRREVKEECGIEIGEVRYLASQSWPFDHSLMIGCIADARSSIIRVDEKELIDAAWFDRKSVQEKLTAAIDALDKPHSQESRLPPPNALAFWLCKHWLQHEQHAKKE